MSKISLIHLAYRPLPKLTVKHRIAIGCERYRHEVIAFHLFTQPRQQMTIPCDQGSEKVTISENRA